MRLLGFDYTRPGQYFITICTFQKRCFLGVIKDGRPLLSRIGKIARDCWYSIPDHFPDVNLDAFVIMPNHIHGIVTIKPRARHAVPLPQHFRGFGNPASGSMATIARSYKSESTRQVRILFSNPSFQLWQRGFYETVLRTGDHYAKAARYISENPLKWTLDRENPNAEKTSAKSL